LQVFAARAAPRLLGAAHGATVRVGVGSGQRVTVAAGPIDSVARRPRADEIFARLDWQGPGPRSDIWSRLLLHALAPRYGLWRGFPDGELWLPELAYWREGDRYVR